MKNINKSQSYYKGVTHSSNTLLWGMTAPHVHWQWLGRTCVNHQELHQKYTVLLRSFKSRVMRRCNVQPKQKIVPEVEKIIQLRVKIMPVQKVLTMPKQYSCSSKRGLMRKSPNSQVLCWSFLTGHISFWEIYSEKEPEGNVEVWGLFEGGLVYFSKNTYFCLTWQMSVCLITEILKDF